MKISVFEQVHCEYRVMPLLLVCMCMYVCTYARTYAQMYVCIIVFKYL